MATPMVICENLVKIYKVADLEVVALQGLDLTVQSGEMVALMGASGSGKSTLLNVLSGLDVPNAGRCLVADYDVTQLSPTQRLRFQREIIGHIWQQGGRNLIAHYTLAENVDVPQLARGTSLSQRRQRTHELLAAVGLSGMEQKYPQQLSGGEQQRAGVAVAVAHRPSVLLADEPTGELDSTTAQQILQLFRQIQSTMALTIIVVTHDPAVAISADRVVSLRDGRTSSETRRRADSAGSESFAGESLLTGLAASTHEEMIVVDRVGRLQLPHDVIESLDIADRVELRRSADHVELWPIREQPGIASREDATGEG